MLNAAFAVGAIIRLPAILPGCVPRIHHLGTGRLTAMTQLHRDAGQNHAPAHSCQAVV
jgi:hypothetical protein